MPLHRWPQLGELLQLWLGNRAVVPVEQSMVVAVAGEKCYLASVAKLATAGYLHMLQQMAICCGICS